MFLTTSVVTRRYGARWKKVAGDAGPLLKNRQFRGTAIAPFSSEDANPVRKPLERKSKQRAQPGGGTERSSKEVVK